MVSRTSKWFVIYTQSEVLVEKHVISYRRMVVWSSTWPKGIIMEMVIRRISNWVESSKEKDSIVALWQIIRNDLTLTTNLFDHQSIYTMSLCITFARDCMACNCKAFIRDCKISVTNPSRNIYFIVYNHGASHFKHALFTNSKNFYCPMDTLYISHCCVLWFHLLFR